eukprot:5679800-Amphidinium_carterae.1
MRNWSASDVASITKSLELLRKVQGAKKGNWRPTWQAGTKDSIGQRVRKHQEKAHPLIQFCCLKVHRPCLCRLCAFGRCASLMSCEEDGDPQGGVMSNAGVSFSQGDA